jgi:hypothetical protein
VREANVGAEKSGGRQEASDKEEDDAEKFHGEPRTWRERIL